MTEIKLQKHKEWKKKKREISLIDFSKFFLLCFFVFKPLYIFKSGSFQLADLLLCLSFVCLLVYKKFSLDLFKEDVLYFVFFLCTLIINSIYFVINENSDFLVSSLYYLYNFFAIILMRYFYRDTRLLKIVTWILRLWMYALASMYVLGIGRGVSSSRYMGTFNDPNQLAVYVLMSFLFIKAYCKIFGFKGIILDDISMVFLVIASSSTGVTIGVIVYYVFTYLNILRKCIVDKKIDRLVLVFIATFLSGVLVIVFFTYILEMIQDTNLFILDRLTEKFNKITNSNQEFDLQSFLKDRNMIRIINYPIYFLFGSGEGVAAVGPLFGIGGEIHSTVVGLFYYYGLVPFIVFMIWFIKNISQSFKNFSWPTIFALICESFTLANQRQPLFWMLVVLVSREQVNKNDAEKN